MTNGRKGQIIFGTFSTSIDPAANNGLTLGSLAQTNVTDKGVAPLKK
jgi:hypothetical protein